MTALLGIQSEATHCIEEVFVTPLEGESPTCPEPYVDRIVIDTLHDGGFIPKKILESPAVLPLVRDGTLREHYIRGRDWGANNVAEQVARRLGLGSYHRVNVARVLMDFNRFPGSSPLDAGPLDRLAISSPLSERLNYEEKRRVLMDYYDVVSSGMERAIAGKLIKISLHTYDERNPSRTQRPEISILSRSHSYQQHSRLPYGIFDPLFPDILVECTAKRIFRDRIALTLEKAGLIVDHNYPYCLPDGSLEVRAQVWAFFLHLRKRFEAEHPETTSDPAYSLVWSTLLNTNLRSSASDAFFGYMHRFRRAPAGRESEFNEARRAYERIQTFTESHPSLVSEYRSSPDRASSLSIEVRKDLVFDFDGGEPVGPNLENARRIGDRIAEAISIYLRTDRADLAR